MSNSRCLSIHDVLPALPHHQSHMDLKKKQKALRLISNGMYIVTSRAGEKYGGATITWLTQASFKPPLVVAAIRPDSKVFECLSESRLAAVHILAAHQHDIARKFLTATEVKNGLMNGEPFVAGKTSVPILKNITSHIECKVSQMFNAGGDHILVVMEVTDVEHLDDVKPLLVTDSP